MKSRARSRRSEADTKPTRAAVTAWLAALVAALGLSMVPARTAGADAATVNSLLDCRFGSGQVFDIAFAKSGTLGVNRTLNVTVSGVPYQSATNPFGPLNGVIAPTDFFQFHPSQTNPGSYALHLHEAGGALKRVVDATGSFEVAGPDVLLYHGGGQTDTLFTTRQVWRYGQTGSFAVTQENLINNEALQYTSCVGPLRMPSPERFEPLSPIRVLDTREGAALGPSVERSLVLAGQHGVPATASAVALNITVDAPAADGWVAAYPCGSTPGTSTLNFGAQETVANLAMVAPGAGGAVCFRSTAATQLVVDLNGYLDPNGSDAYTPVVPARVYDSRVPAVAVPAGGAIAMRVAGWYGTPNSSTAAMLNVTVTNPAAAGYATVYPCGSARPLASNVNFRAGQTVANAAVGRIGEGGAVCIYASASVDLVIDVTGAFGPTGETVPMAVAPFRAADTRESGRLAAGEVLVVDLADRDGLYGVIPSGALLNVTVTEPVEAGFLTVYACDSERPWASNLNFLPGETAANFAIGAVSAGDQRVCLFSTATTHVVVDVSGALVAYD